MTRWIQEPRFSLGKKSHAICPLTDSPGPNAHYNTPEHYAFRSTHLGTTRATGTIRVVPSGEPQLIIITEI
jgi:hypothetical protein